MEDEQLGYFEAHGADAANLEFKALPVLVADGAPPRAIYLCTIKATQDLSKASGNDMVTMVLTVDEPEEFAGRRVFDHFLPQFSRTRHHLMRIMGKEWVNSLSGSLRAQNANRKPFLA